MLMRLGEGALFIGPHGEFVSVRVMAMKAPGRRLQSLMNAPPLCPGQ
jgi:hypothetical protein